MERENMKIKREPENQMRKPDFASLDLEFEKKMMESKKASENQAKENPIDARIKTEEVINYDESQMLAYLNNSIWELKNQILQQDRVARASQIQEETKAAKMEKEIQELKLQKQMDDKIIEELRNRVSESEIREQKLTETVEELLRRISALEDENEGLTRQRSETVKVAGVGVKRFENLVPITENLTSLLKMSLANLKDMFAGDEAAAGTHETKADDVIEMADKSDVKMTLAKEMCAGTHGTKDDDIIEILDESDEEKEKLGKSCTVPAANDHHDHQTNKRKEPSKNSCDCYVHKRIEEAKIKKKKMEMSSI